MALGCIGLMKSNIHIYLYQKKIYENRRIHEGQSETSLSPDSCIEDIADHTMLTCLEFYENFMMNRLGCARQLS